ncbi:MAG: enoyl-CoA hydratase/isomerase family protein [Ottowia sp.]|uniref:enoyl-CoA hydratase/isomerase family protein n=1 Tax=Ottowia sp. TaxID=1898956 RepID=UPI003C7895D6
MNLDYNVADGVATITINNPPVNVFTPELHQQFAGLLRSFLADDTVRVGILTGAGQRAFCAGDDIKTERPVRTHAELVRRHMSVRHEAESLEYPGWEKEVMLLGLRRYKPIIAAVNGVVMGQGMVYLMHLTDIRIASSTARFGLPEIAYGMGGAGGSTRLEHQIPPVAAMWLALTGEPFDAEAALRYNLVNEVVQPEELMSRAREVAALIARHPALAVRTEMEAISRTRDMTKEQTLEYIGNLYRLQRVAFGTEMPLAGKRVPSTVN